MAINNKVYVAPESIAIRTGYVAARYRVNYCDFIINQSDLKRIQLQPGETMDDILEEIEEVSSVYAQQLIRIGGRKLGYQGFVRNPEEEARIKAAQEAKKKAKEEAEAEAAAENEEESLPPTPPEGKGEEETPEEQVEEPAEEEAEPEAEPEPEPEPEPEVVQPKKRTTKK